MCRFALYLGPPVQLASLLTEPSHSLIRQSFQSEEREEPLNGDGFGVGWYSPRLTPEPAAFHEITPAWNNQNLQSIARVIASPCVMAHVRAATPGSGVNLVNCHPFSFQRYLLMHNGHVGGFRRIRRAILNSVRDEAFDIVRGSTDTEHLFAVFVDELLESGDPDGGAEVLAEHLARAISRVLALVAASGDGAPSFLNVAVSDGSHAAVTRFTDHPSEAPESLYVHDGELYEPAGRRFRQKRAEDQGRAVLVSSERLTDDARWRTVPANSMVVLDRWSEPRIFSMARDGALQAEVTA